MASSVDVSLDDLLRGNEAEIVFFYRLATWLLVLVLVSHLVFSAYYLYAAQAINEPGVLLFAVFNIAALVVEIYLSRIAFMLGSRAGQLRDMRYALLIADSTLDTSRFEAASRAIMSLRRDAGALKIIDIEAIAGKLSKPKTTGKDAA
jgi:hypothetical protein